MAKWMVSAKKADFNGMAEKFHIDPVIARIIRNRDVIEEGDIERFLHGTPEDLHAPREMKDMEKGVHFILDKIAQKASIRIIGDYDIDGVCSTYILLRGLVFCGAEADTVIPHRIKDGYGINDALITEAKEDGIDSIITCDNGISAMEQIAYAKTLGISVVVTDHHEVPYEVNEDGEKTEIVPPADAVIDPKQAKCTYPFKGICGGVVAYKFVQTLLEEYEKHIVDFENTDACNWRERANALLTELLEFAAFATVGDVMELRDENRIIVRYGLQSMMHTKNIGLQALIEISGLQDKSLSPYHIGFVLGPCLNATGRLDSAQKALELLQSDNRQEAVTIAGLLKELNDSRKEMTRKGTEEAIALIENTDLKNDKVLVVYLPQCHESLAGIIAGRIREYYYKPVYVMTKSEIEGELKGSGRSIEAYSMYEQMTLCKHLFSKFGGHKMAAGFSLPEENREMFRKEINACCKLSENDFEEKIVIDVPMPLSYIKKELIKELEVLEPFGNGNPKPVFAQKNVRLIQGRILGKNQNVGKFKVADEQGKNYDMIYFGDIAKWNQFLTEKFGRGPVEALYRGKTDAFVLQVDILYYPDINVYQGKESLQIVMQDYK